MYLLFEENHSYFYQKVWTKFMQLYLFNMSPNVAFTWQHFSLILFCIFSNENWWQVLDHGLCYISKLIGDMEDTLKFFMAFNITACRLIFRVMVEPQKENCSITSCPKFLLSFAWLVTLTFKFRSFKKLIVTASWMLVLILHVNSRKQQ